MECFLALIVLLVALAATIAAATGAQHRIQVWNHAFRALARRHRGRFSRGGWFGQPYVRFPYAGDWALVKLIPVNNLSSSCTIQIDLPLSDPTLDCEVSTRRTSLHDSFGPPNDAASLSGSKEFDLEYAVNGPDPQRTRAFLSDGVRLQINQLRHLLGNDNVHVAARRGRLWVRKLVRHMGPQLLEQVVQLSIDLHDQATLASGEGISYMPPQASSDATCQICGGIIDEGLVFCRRCKTPHHRDCWHYNGACSVFGCEETHYTQSPD